MLQLFFYVTGATLDLSVFGSDRLSMIQGLGSTHRSVRFQPLPLGSKATIEGPFSAVQALRDDLISRAKAQTTALELRETPLNPRAISHQEFSGSLSCSNSETNRDAAGANGVSRPLQSTVEARGVQSLLANAESPNSPERQRMQRDSLDPSSGNSSRARPTQSSVFSLDGMRSSLSGTEYRSERGGADTRQVLGEEEMDAGIRSSSSRPDRLPGKEMPPKQTRPGRASANQSSTETRLASQLTGGDYEKKSEIDKKLLHASSYSDIEDTEKLSKVHPQELEDECIWVDSNIFRYIERFDRGEFKGCFRNQEVSIWHDEDTDLTQITPIGRQMGSQQALETLRVLVGYRQSTLRVHWMDFDLAEQCEEQRLIQICDGENAWYRDVLYMVEGSGVKVVGPSLSSHLFCERVKERITKMKVT